MDNARYHATFGPDDRLPGIGANKNEILIFLQGKNISCSVLEIGGETKIANTIHLSNSYLSIYISFLIN